MLIACPARFAGRGKDGGEESVTRAQFEADGWRAAATLTADDDTQWLVLARPCRAGESFRIRTDKYDSPVMIR